ncbi:LacI family DNA-binding transcriptional regulator [Diplocloster modestus]|uniref:LacI family DNA-binding transcriptional regulator n=1 Tax=Diplocloster modestus TaxID=2850322 RepID=A0ABS6KCW6_9FIRM|nr:LacI family DNA-binding transcriptional regulator [Diplocloster modestus]MBU9728361.1 LacI family DNA-binding transcriptional regulator [Diplocloster modestus]
MKVGIKEISNISGFSQATVSNVLNGKAGVNEETAAKIMEIARSSGYFQSKKFKKIRLVLYKKHGNILDDTPFFSLLFEGVETGCRENGLKLEMNVLDESKPNFETELREITRDISSGILLVATEMCDDSIRKFSQAASPLVVIDNRFDFMPFHSVSTENEKSVYYAVRYLIGNGHQEIGFINSKVPIYNFYRREQGYRQALKDSGLNSKLPAVELHPAMEEAYLDMKKYLETKPKLCSAYFVVDDMIAHGVIKALKESGYHIPRDVSLIGFDDLPYSAISSPCLSTIRVFKQEMGRVAVNMLVNNIGVVGTTLHSEISTEFMNRDSIRLQ